MAIGRLRKWKGDNRRAHVFFFECVFFNWEEFGYLGLWWLMKGFYGCTGVIELLLSICRQVTNTWTNDTVTLVSVTTHTYVFTITAATALYQIITFVYHSKFIFIYTSIHEQIFFVKKKDINKFLLHKLLINLWCSLIIIYMY